MCILKTAQLRDQTLKLLFIERDQVAEQLDMIGYEQRKAAPMVLRDSPAMCMSTFELTDTIQPVSMQAARARG